MNTFRVKITAIAKDEAAYIPEWIYHHLHFGFDHIEVIVNRTTDNSAKVLGKISAINHSVSFLHYDWIDLCPEVVQRQIQYIAYADAYNRAIDEGYTHLLFIDIDEYWTPTDFSTNIHDYLSAYPEDSSFSFNWFCELGVNEEFSGIQKKFKFFSNEHVKTLINLSSSISQIKIHAPLFNEDARHLIANGTAFVPRDNNAQFHKYPIDEFLPAFIIHRMYRSEIEYVSSLLRGNPNSTETISSLFKDNRHGFKTTSATLETINFPSEPYSKYTLGFQKFIERYELSDYASEAKLFVINRAIQSIAAAKDLAIIDKELAKKIFSGCSNPDVLTMLNSYVDAVQYKIDSIIRSGNSIDLLGWVISPYVKKPFHFDITPEFDGTIVYKRVSRPDVVETYPYAQLNCGFKISIILNSPCIASIHNDKTIFNLYASELDIIRTVHHTSIYFNTANNLLQQVFDNKKHEAVGKLPVFFMPINNAEALAVLLNGKVMVCSLDSDRKINLVDLNSFNDSHISITKVPINASEFSITAENLFLSAIKDGPIVFDRPVAKAWEVFTTANDPTSVSKNIFELNSYLKNYSL